VAPWNVSPKFHLVRDRTHCVISSLLSLEYTKPYNDRSALPDITFDDRKGSVVKLKKCPDAPKRFKSAFIIFSSEKHKEIKKELAAKGEAQKHTTDVAKLVSEAWRKLSSEERAVWDEKAREDKERYEMERVVYAGPWKVPANRRTPKDPSAPKRPMSAFLAYSNKLRASLKKENPKATNAELSKMLSNMWKEAPMDIKKKHIDEEAKLREKYKEEMAQWRAEKAHDKMKQQEQRQAFAKEFAAQQRAREAQTGHVDAMVGPTMYSTPGLMHQKQQQFLMQHLMHQQPPPAYFSGATPFMTHAHAYGVNGMVPAYPPSYEAVVKPTDQQQHEPDAYDEDN